MNRIRSFLIALCLSLSLVGGALAADRVNINQADAATIAETLNGVGPSKAEAIVAWREANGPFKSAEQLAEVKGIGLKTVEKNRERISLGETSPKSP